MQTVNILTEHSQGLLNDARILSDALHDCGLKAKITVINPQSLHPGKRYPRAWHRLSHPLAKPIYRFNFHLEEIRPTWSSIAAVNVFIPNPEFHFPDRAEHKLQHIDHILCKTKNAEAIFKPYSRNITYLGFNSIDRFDPGLKKDFRKFLHVMGKSHLKGTKTLLEVWARYPSFPVLNVVINATKWNAETVSEIRKLASANVRLIEGPVPDQQLRKLQNECGIHLCPSEAEGFGHYIVEAMSTGSIVVTTDAAPMNEHVGQDCGFLIPASAGKPMGLGQRWHVQEEALRRAIADILATPVETLEQLGTAARARYEDMQTGLSHRLQAWLQRIAQH